MVLLYSDVTARENSNEGKGTCVPRRSGPWRGCPWRRCDGPNRETADKEVVLGPKWVRANHWFTYSVMHSKSWHVKLAPFNRDNFRWNTKLLICSNYKGLRFWLVPKISLCKKQRGSCYHCLPLSAISPDNLSSPGSKLDTNKNCIKRFKNKEARLQR